MATGRAAAHWWAGARSSLKGVVLSLSPSRNCTEPVQGERVPRAHHEAGARAPAGPELRRCPKARRAGLEPRDVGQRGGPGAPPGGRLRLGPKERKPPRH